MDWTKSGKRRMNQKERQKETNIDNNTVASPRHNKKSYPKMTDKEKDIHADYFVIFDLYQYFEINPKIILNHILKGWNEEMFLSHQITTDMTPSDHAVPKVYSINTK